MTVLKYYLEGVEELRNERMLKTKKRCPFGHDRLRFPLLRNDRQDSENYLLDKALVHDLHGIVLFRVLLLCKEDLGVNASEWQCLRVRSFAQLFSVNKVLHADFLWLRISTVGATFVGALMNTIV